MKVALYHNLPPGGALRALSEFLRRAADLHEFDLFTVDLGPGNAFSYTSDRAEQRDLSPFVSQTFHYPLFGRLSRRLPLGKLRPLHVARRLPSVEREIAAAMNRGGYDVAYVHPCQVEHTPTILRFLAIPSVHYMHEPRRQSFEAGYRERLRLTGLTSAPRWAATALLERSLSRRDVWAASAATRIVCNSHYSGESILRAYGIEAELCPPGIDTSIFTVEGDGRLLLPTVPGGAVSVGALERIKGHDLVVQALGLLPADERPALHLVYERCDEDYRREVQALARQLEVQLTLHRGISDRELASLYRSANVTVVAARLEPLGLVPLESLACGTPVVAIAEGGFRETVSHGVNGYLTRSSASDLAEATRRVLRGELRTSPAALRQRVLRDWDWGTSVKRQSELLARTADEGQRSN